MNTFRKPLLLDRSDITAVTRFLSMPRDCRPQGAGGVGVDDAKLQLVLLAVDGGMVPERLFGRREMRDVNEPGLVGIQLRRE